MEREGGRDREIEGERERGRDRGKEGEREREGVEEMYAVSFPYHMCTCMNGSGNTSLWHVHEGLGMYYS